MLGEQVTDPLSHWPCQSRRQIHTLCLLSRDDEACSAPLEQDQRLLINNLPTLVRSES